MVSKPRRFITPSPFTPALTTLFTLFLHLHCTVLSLSLLYVSFNSCLLPLATDRSFPSSLFASAAHSDDPLLSLDQFSPLRTLWLTQSLKGSSLHIITSNNEHNSDYHNPYSIHTSSPALCLLGYCSLRHTTLRLAVNRISTVNKRGYIHFGGGYIEEDNK